MKPFCCSNLCTVDVIPKQTKIKEIPGVSMNLDSASKTDKDEMLRLSQALNKQPDDYDIFTFAKTDGFLATKSVSKNHPVAKSRKTMKVPGRLFATYKLLPSFKYCERLQCYVDDADNVDQEIPAPHPPPTRKSDIFNIAQYATVDERAINTPIKFLKQPLKELVDYLTAGYNNDMAKLRVIYRWITSQPLDRLTLHKEPPQTHAVFQLWRIQHKKGNYAQLVSLLCRYADIPCVIVHGTLKGSTYEVGDHIDEDKHYGEWNAVLIDNHWRLINAYWGTCAEGATENRLKVTAPISNGNEQTYYNCDENYFLIDPEQAAATHFPTSPSWQLTEKPLTMEEFEKMAFVKDRYFNLNLKILSHPECVIINDIGEEEIRFGVPKETSLNIDFQYLMFRLADNGDEERMQGYVFMHRTNNNETLNICVRSPTESTVRFELVGRDRSIQDELNDFDWIAIYKIIFRKGLENCRKFSMATAIGWGPGRVVTDEGLEPHSHFSGIVPMDHYGRTEIRFGKVDQKIHEMEFVAKVYTSGEKMEEIPDYVVHRVENGEVVFNVMTPNAGEYVLKLFIKCNENNKVRSFCDYMLTSNQKENNDKFPKGFQTRLGPKEPRFSASALSTTMPSGFIMTEHDRVKIAFTRGENIELSMNLSGEKVKPAEAPLLFSQKQKGAILEYKIRLPDTGVFGVKVRGTKQTGAVHEPLYDCIIDYRKLQKKPKNEPIVEQEPEILNKQAPVDSTTSEKIVVKPVDFIEKVEPADIPLEVVRTTEPEEVIDARQESLPETTNETKEPQTASPEICVEAVQEENISELTSSVRQSLSRKTNEGNSSMQLLEKQYETIPDILRRRMRICIEEKNAKELTNVIGELKDLKLVSVESDINYGVEELNVITLRKELIDGIREKSSKNMKAALKAIKAADLEGRLRQEVYTAKTLIERIKKLQKLLHAVLALDQSTIMEIRSYGKPPPAVHTVMMATLLLLGHWEEETSKWKNVQIILGRTGKDSLKRQISEFQIEKCALEVAMGARDSLRDYSIDQVRLVSAGCATFYVWVKGVVEELEKRAGEEFNNIRPKTSMSKMRKRELTFLGDLSP